MFMVTIPDNHGLSKDITEAVMWRFSIIRCSSIFREIHMKTTVSVKK